MRTWRKGHCFAHAGCFAGLVANGSLARAALLPVCW